LDACNQSNPETQKRRTGLLFFDTNEVAKKAPPLEPASKHLAGLLLESSSGNNPVTESSSGNPFADASEDSLLTTKFMNMSPPGRMPSRSNYAGQEFLRLPVLPQDGVDVVMRPAANPPPSRSSAMTFSLDGEQAPNDEAADHHPTRHTPALVSPSPPPPPPAVVEHGSSDTVFSPLTDLDE
jgi:hypothetical protein